MKLSSKEFGRECDQRVVLAEARRSRRAPRTTKKSGTIRPWATPVTWRDSRSGPPTAATMQAGPKPGNEHTGAAVLGQPEKPKEDKQREAEIKRPAARLREDDAPAEPTAGGAQGAQQ